MWFKVTLFLLFLTPSAWATSWIELAGATLYGVTNGTIPNGGSISMISSVLAVGGNFTSVTGTLTSSDACVTIGTSSSSYGSVSSGATANSTAPVTATISSGCVSGSVPHLSVLTYTITASGFSGKSITIPILVSVKPVPLILPPYTCTTNYYVSAYGNDSNAGISVATAWASIQQAESYLQGISNSQPNVCVNFEPGFYSGYGQISAGLGGTSSGYLTFRSVIPFLATANLPTADAPTAGDDGTNFFQLDEANYVVIDGFYYQGDNSISLAQDSGMTFNTYPVASDGSHIIIIKNMILNAGGDGVNTVHTDYNIVEGNYVGWNAHTSDNEDSGISIAAMVASDTNSGFHNVIAYNQVFGNEEVSNGYSTHSDGNGIIIDTSNNSGAGGFPAYAYDTLVEYNVSWGNGGKGVHIFLSNLVTVLNNTTYNNTIDPIGSASERDEIDAINALNNTFINNVSYALQVTNTGSYPNYAFYDSGNSFENTGNVWYNNIGYANGSTTVHLFNTTATINTGSPENNIINVNPLFNALGTNDFSLQSTSEAIGAGTSAYGYPSIDMAGNTVNPSYITMGAYQVPSTISATSEIGGNFKLNGDFIFK